MDIYNALFDASLPQPGPVSAQRSFKLVGVSINSYISTRIYRIHWQALQGLMGSWVQGLPLLRAD